MPQLRLTIFFIALPVILLSRPVMSAAQTTGARAAAETLSVAQVMKGTAFVGTSPSRLRWAPDGSALYFQWKQTHDEAEGLYRVDAGGDPQRVPEEEALRLDSKLDASLSEDGRWGAYAYRGEVHRLDVRSNRDRTLVSVAGDVSHVQIAPDGSAVYFVHDDNLFHVDASTGALVQLTDIRHGEPEAEEEPDAHREFLKEQERELLRVFEEDSLRRVRSWPPPDTAEADTLQAFYVGERETIGTFAVSPQGRRMAFSLTKEPAGMRRAWVPDYVNEDGYTDQAPRERPFVGDDQPYGRLGIMDLATGAVTWVDHGQGGRRVDLTFRGWSDDGERLLAVGVSFDFHDRWILRIDSESGESMILDHLYDDAWIGGPAVYAAGWMPGTERIWYISEATGFAHLYTVAAGGGEPTPLTSGPWEVISAELSPDEEEWYLVTSEASPHERHFYRMDVDGGERRRVTTRTLQGDQGRDIDAVATSPDGKRLAALYAWPNHPPELFLQDNRSGARGRQVTHSTTQEFDAYDWYAPEIIYLPARDGGDVPARLYRPEAPNGAGVIFVHGAGYLQNVHRWWSTYYREYMFHNLLRDRGYTVLDIDYRGSAGYGRDWRTAIHKHMGGTDLSDQVDGARFLVDSLGVDTRRIGIYGGSYGGFITLMAMFTEPGTFAAGAALRPVTDWSHYNHWYTSRILGLPQDDPRAYERSSPIYHAEGLQGALLMAHGMIDQNVHFQDTVRLAQRLIELGKRDWEVAIYPKEDHGFVHGWSWADEYSRILELFERHLHPAEAHSR